MKKDFKNLDSMIKFNFRKDLYSLVKDHGCKYVSECVYVLYYKDKRSIRQVAKAMAKSFEVILYWMRKWDFERSPKGGNVKNNFLKNPGIIENILSLKGHTTQRKAAEIIHCCQSTIQTAWKAADSNL